MRNATDTIQIDFGHRSAIIAIGDVRDWRSTGEDGITAACKKLKLKADHDRSHNAPSRLAARAGDHTRHRDVYRVTEAAPAHNGGVKSRTFRL